jgi:ribosome biogenesis GTPase A
MRIHWYPGHMVTARKDAVEAMGTTHLVIEVLDARSPHASCNPVVETLRKQNRRPALKLLNKADLADHERTSTWLAYYNALPEVTAIAVSAKSPGDVGRILKAARGMVPDRGTPARPLRMMILGVPNAGKSTLMNALLKRRVAAVGDQPAVTKMHMGHALGKDMWLIDTPGLLWPGIEHQSALRLAALHSIGTNGYDDQDVAVELGHYLLRHYPGLVTRRFGEIAPGSDGHGLLALVARTRSLVMKAGAPDLNKAAIVLLNDFRSGALGRITLESPDGARVGGA